MVKNILIIFPRFDPRGNLVPYNANSTDKVYNYLMPVGMPYISAVLKRAGHNVKVLNLNHMEGLIKDILKQELLNNTYRFVFTGGLSMIYPNIRDIVSYVREYSPDTKIVVGGGIISAQPELMFKLIKPDVGVLFEGEMTCQEIVDGKDLKDIKGIIYGEGIKTERREPITNLDMLPIPDWEGFGLMEYLDNQKPDLDCYDSIDNPRSYSIVGSRSCVFKCSFCFHTIGNKYRQRSIDNIMEEIKWAVDKYNVNHFDFLDELFAYDKPRALEFLARFRDFIKTVPYEIRLFFNIRSDNVDVEILNAVRECGFVVIGLGLESMSDVVLDSMKKHMTAEQTTNCLTLIALNRLNILGTYIFGDPAETLDTAKETIDFYIKRQDILRGGSRLAFVIPFAGSEVYNNAVKKGLIDEMEFINNLEKNGYDFFNPINLTGLNDADFETLKDMVFTAEYKAKKYAVPECVHDNEMILKCPHCGERITLMNIPNPQGFGTVNVICRNDKCRGRFFVVTPWYKYLCAAVKLIGYNKLCELKKKYGRRV
jgi:radical SAM superfamily enzyme YgiQ (UPF0313 family)